jgi:hypothetical protein
MLVFVSGILSAFKLTVTDYLWILFLVSKKGILNLQIQNKFKKIEWPFPVPDCFYILALYEMSLKLRLSLFSFFTFSK